MPKTQLALTFLSSFRFSLLLLVCGLTASAGCSAIVSPDPSRLGDTDAGAGSRDAMVAGDTGPRPDTGPGTDASVGPDGGPVCPPSCDDSVACTTDACVDGVCRHVPDDDACPGDERCNLVMGCVPARCEDNSQCDDGLFCNGAERCDLSAPGSGCVPGVAPACGDAFSCTTDSCSDAAGACVHNPNHAACADALDCTVDSCDPAASSDATGCVREADDARCDTDFCFTGRVCAPDGCTAGTRRSCADGMLCTMDSCDSAARACVNAPLDADGDGYSAQSAMGAGGPTVLCGGPDCNDGNAAVNPGAMETCNGIDDNCDGTIDEGCTTIPDTCATAQAITLDGAGRGTATGTFAGLTDDYTPSRLCSTAGGGRDAVYYFDLPSGTWDVAIDTLGSAADTVLGVGFECSASGLAASCNDDYAGSGGPTASRIWLHRVGTGRVFVLVDAYSASTAGAYTLNITRSAARADSCPSASGTPLDITEGGTVVGFQSGFVGSQRGSCQSAGDVGGEAVFFLRGPSTGRMDFDVYSVDFTPDIYVRRAPCTSGMELGCDTGSSLGGGVNQAELTLTGVGMGEAHFLIVDGGRGGYLVHYTPR